jgi:hypothetical protein
MSTTRLVITTVVIALGIYDLAAIKFGGVDASISRYFQKAGKYPGPVFVLGYICGHIFGWMN